MKNKTIKAMFEIFLVVSITFVFALANASQIYAEEERVCCQKALIDGEERYCQYTDSENCVGGSGFPGKCEDFNACQPVCCDLNNAGYSASFGLGCFKNVPASVCKNQFKGDVIPDPLCTNAQQCQRGCCVVGSQCSLMTDDTCSDYVGNNYPDLDVDFRVDVTDELECQNVCRAERRGCCVVEDSKKGNDCGLVTFAECNADGGRFFEGVDCINVPDNKCKHCSYGAGVLKSEWKSGCNYDLSDDVYYFDKCENPIVFGDVKKPCKYSEGFLCREDGKGKASCDDLNCKTDVLWDNPRVDENGNCRDNAGISDPCWEDDDNFFGRNFRVNGESWCEFDADAGPGRDLPGTRHYVHSCIEGSEQVFECKDFREEYCFQFNGEKQSAAKCLPNRVIESPCGACEDKECCTNNNERDCLWIPINRENADDNKNGLCIPIVPPGTKDNPELCGFSERKEDKVEFKQVLDLETAWHNAGWGLDWGCDDGCEFYTQKFAYPQNSLCGFAGDCGAKYNLAGEWGDEGFSRSCSVDSEIRNDYGDVNEDVDEYKYFEKDGQYGEGEGVGDLIEDCLEELPDPADKTDGEFNFESLLNYNKLLVGKLPDDVAGMSLLKVYKWTIISGSLLGGASIFIAGFLGATGGTALLIALAVWAAVVGIAKITGADTSMQTVTLTCNAWNPPSGSKNCHLCNEVGDINYLLPDGNKKPMSVDFTAEGKHDCSPYLCWSLGEGCEFEVTEDGPRCISACDTKDNGKSDIIFNVNQISPLDLSEQNLMKCRGGDNFNSEEKDCKPNDINNGYDLNFVKANTRVVVGVETDELATCKWDWERRTGSSEEDVFNLMEKSFDQLAPSFNHTITLEPGIDLMPEDEKTMYVNCMDTCENTNYPQYYSINIKVAKMEDKGSPIFDGINPENGAAVRYDLDETNVKLKLDQPAICRWSRTNDLYDAMVNEFSCKTEYNRDGCEFTLTNLQKGNNIFYIRCSDDSGNKNIDALPNSDGYSLFRSESLNITNVRCVNNFGDTCDTIYDKNFTIETTTFGGGYSGKARCFARELDSLEFEFKNTGENIHTQPIGPIVSGVHNYRISCVDDAGNEDTKILNFNVVIDEENPEVLKINLKDNILNVLTDEDSSCKYGLSKDLIYDEMVDFDSTGGKEHSVSVEDKPYLHVKCKDRFSHVTSFDVYTK